MRRFVSVLGIFVIILGSFSLIAKPIAAQGGTPDWSVKDFWDYSGTFEINSQQYTAILHIEVKEKAKLTVGGNSYDTNHCTMSLTASFGGSSFTMTSDIYMRTSDMADIKMESTIMTTTTTVTYDPPLETFKFPLSNGQTWTSTSEQTTKTGGNTSTDSITNVYTVTGPSSITVPAGTFKAFTVTSHEQGSSSNSVVDYSDTVGSMIRIGGDFMGFNSSEPFALKSYSYQKPGNTTMLIVGIIILVVVIAVIAVLLVWRSKRKAQKQPPMQPHGQPIYGQQPQYPQPPPYQPPPPPPPQP